MKITIAGVEYDAKYKVDAALMQNGFEIGNCIAKTLTLSIVPTAPIPRSAEVKTDFGTFYVVRRSGDRVVTLDCGDKMLALGGVYETGEDVEYPKKTREVLSDISERVGLSVVAELDADYEISYPNDLTIRDMLSRIGIKQGGNWWINYNDELELVKPDKQGRIISIDGKPFSKYDSTGETTITQVVLQDDSDNVFIAGEDDSSPLTLFCEWGTQTIADNLYERFRGYTHAGHSITNLHTNELLKLGDILNIDGKTFPVNSLSVNASSNYVYTLSNPNSVPEDVEFGYEGEFFRKIANKLTLGGVYDNVSFRKKGGIFIKGSDELFEANLGSRRFSMSALDDAGEMTPAIYFDTAVRRYKITGQVIIEGGLIVNNLYADNGAIANLTVDRLRTDYDRALNYLNGDTSDIYFQDIHDEHSYFITASTDGTQTEHYKNPQGELLYWIEDPTIQDGSFKRMDTKITEFPVIVYVYTETIKGSIAFEDVVLSNNNTTVTPVITLGAGEAVGSDKGKAKIWKGLQSLHIKYVGYADLELRQDGNGYINGRKILLAGDDPVPPTPEPPKPGGTVSTIVGDGTVLNDKVLVAVCELENYHHYLAWRKGSENAIQITEIKDGKHYILNTFTPESGLSIGASVGIYYYADRLLIGGRNVGYSEMGYIWDAFTGENLGTPVDGGSGSAAYHAVNSFKNIGVDGGGATWNVKPYSATARYASNGRLRKTIGYNDVKATGLMGLTNTNALVIEYNIPPVLPATVEKSNYTVNVQGELGATKGGYAVVGAGNTTLIKFTSSSLDVIDSVDSVGAVFDNGLFFTKGGIIYWLEDETGKITPVPSAEIVAEQASSTHKFKYKHTYNGEMIRVAY